MSPAPRVRPATPDDAGAVSAVLAASYPVLLAPAYDPDLLARVLPVMTRANPRLLACGTFHVAEIEGLGVVGCGGWTRERPDDPRAPIDPALGHLRHFGTRPEVLRRGVGRAIFARCAAEARAAGVGRFECWSTLVARSFYESLGFVVRETIAVPMPGGSLPALRMEADVPTGA